MSIQSEIDRIITAVGSAYDAVESKGGTATAAQTIGGLATAVGTIPTGIAPQLIVTVSAGATVTATNGSKTISGTADSTGVCTLTVPETGTWNVSATLGGQTSDTKTVSITGSYAVALSFVRPTLNDNEWSVIKSVSDAGQGANYWSIGDRKEVTLDGTVGHLTLSNYTTYAFIIGFNHNQELEGANRIHFQFAKTALSGGTDVALCDSKYNSQVSAMGYFSMNSSATNSGGWKSSQMRTKICGTSLSSYSGTIIAVIPAALRAVLKSVTKYTDNTGSSSDANAVTATTDYFFLLSEYEVFGSIQQGNAHESSKQAQYSYYSAGNSKVKYNYSATSEVIYWWLRSPREGSSAYFADVNGTGVPHYSDARYSNGLVSGFCV